MSRGMGPVAYAGEEISGVFYCLDGVEIMKDKYKQEVQEIITMLRRIEEAKKRGIDIDKLLRDVAHGDFKGIEDYRMKE